MSNMQIEFNKAVEQKAADVAMISTYTMRAVQQVANAIRSADPEIDPSKALGVSVQLVTEMVQDIQDGLTPLGPIGPAVLGKSLMGSLGEHVTAAMVRNAERVATTKQRERQKRVDEQHRLDMLRAPVNGGDAGPSLGLDLGQHAKDMAAIFAAQDARAAAPTAPQPSAFIDPDADIGTVQRAGEATLARAYPAHEKGPAPSAARVAETLAKADTALDLAPGGGKYPAKRKGR